jgi:hypothetical protein
MLPMNNENYKFIAHVGRELGLARSRSRSPSLPSLRALVRRICPPVADGRKDTLLGEDVDATTGVLLEIAGSLSPKERSSLGVRRTTSRRRQFMTRVTRIQKTMQRCKEVFNEIWNPVHSMGVPGPDDQLQQEPMILTRRSWRS